MTIQLARALTDLNVIATASQPETQKWVNRMGAHHIVDEPQLGMLSVGHVEKNYATSGNLEISLSKVTG